MDDVRTLVEMLERRVASTPKRAAFLWEGRETSYEEVWEAASRLAAHLQGNGVVAGDRVVIVLPNGPEFFTAFYAVLRLGGIAVPSFPAAAPESVASRARLCGARIVIVPSECPPEDRRALAREVREGVITCVADSNEVPVLERGPSVAPAAVAMLQYTSGSTGDPKGVKLSHDNLVTNVRQLIAGMRITEQEVFVSWLPVYHDMGLILKTLVPFYLGARLVLLPTSLTNVRTWLGSIQEHRATFTAAPDFAYRLCLRSIRDTDAYDLRSLRVALNAAEPVRASTVEAFERAFHLEGIMVAGYGLAEATVGVSMWPPGSRPRVDAAGRVSVGPPFPRVEVKVVADGRVLGPGEVGSIWIRSAANTTGYWENPAATARLFREDGYLDSGDLGCLDDGGNLYIAGRSKNIIITAGRNVAPREIEEIVDTLPPVRFSAAVGVDRGQVEGEQPYVFAELRRPLSEAASDELAVGIVEKLHARLALRPGRVYLVRPRAIPRTYNGKVQYELLKARYESGALRSEGLIAFPDY